MNILAQFRKKMQWQKTTSQRWLTWCDNRGPEPITNLGRPGVYIAPKI